MRVVACGMGGIRGLGGKNRTWKRLLPESYEFGPEFPVLPYYSEVYIKFTLCTQTVFLTSYRFATLSTLTFMSIDTQGNQPVDHQQQHTRASHSARLVSKSIGRRA